ncbi:MAG: magnesium transporter [Candidatus Micrarchaeota archaeon]
MQVFDKNFKEISVAELLSVAGGLAAGTLIATNVDKILLYPGMLVLLPGFLEMRGNITGSFASRLSSGLFLKVLKPWDMRSKIVTGNIIAAAALGVVISLFLGFAAFFLSLLVFKQYAIKIIFVSLIAGVLTTAVEITLALYATFYLFGKGHDPNNIMGPVVTSTGDVSSVVFLFLALAIV